MSVSKVINIINDIEKRYPVEKWLVNDIYIWPIFRQHLAGILLSKSKLPSNKKTDNMGLSILLKYIKFFFIYIYSCIRDVANNDNKGEVFALFWICTAQRAKLDKKWINRFCYPIIQYFTKKNLETIVVEYSAEDIYRIPRFDKSKYIPFPFIYLFYFLKAKFEVTSKKNVQLEKFNDAIIYIKEKYDISDLEKYNNTLLHRINVIKNLSIYFDNIIMKHNPKIIFQVCYYDVPGWALNYSCRKNGILSVDIQHGIAGDLHPSYGNWTKVPGQGYNVLPNCFFCWNMSDAQSIKKWNNQVKFFHFPLITGNIWNEQWFDESNELVEIFDNRFKEFKNSLDLNLKKIILFTLSCSTAPEIIINVIKMCPDDWFWGIRLHPTMNKKENNNIYNIIKTNNFKNVNIDFFSNMPLPAILRNTDAHVTEISAVVFEAKEFNVNSIIINKEGKDFFAKGIAEGWVHPAFSQNEIILQIKKILNNKVKRPSEGKFLLENALNEIIQKIQTV